MLFVTLLREPCRGVVEGSPVVPVITVIAADHGTPIIWLVASRTDPDLIPPLISDLKFLNREGEKPEMEWGKRTKKRAG